MAFQSKNLSVLAYANGFTQWHYSTTDEAVTGANYFDPAADTLRTGDVVMANVHVGGSAARVESLIVAVADGVVAVQVMSAAAVPAIAPKASAA